jgi:hypothetical protein
VAENFSCSFAPVGSFTQDAFAPVLARATCGRVGQDSYILMSKVGSARSWRRGKRYLSRDQGSAEAETNLVPLPDQAHGELVAS